MVEIRKFQMFDMSLEEKPPSVPDNPYHHETTSFRTSLRQPEPPQGEYPGF